MKAKSILKGVALCLGLATAVGVITNAYAATPSKNKYLSIYDKNNKQVFYQPVSDLNYVEVAEYQQPQVDPDEELKKVSHLNFTVNGVSFDMMPVEGGELYHLLNPYEGSTSATELMPDIYFMAQFQVTHNLWDKVFGKVYYSGKYPLCPRVSTSDSILLFIDKLNIMLASQLPKGYKFCLPTECEWEYAANGGKKSHNYTYSTSNSVQEALNMKWKYNSTYDRIEYTFDAGRFVTNTRGNELLLCGMTGNIMELTSSTNSNSKKIAKGCTFNSNITSSNNTYGINNTSILKNSERSLFADYSGFRLCLKKVK